MNEIIALINQMSPYLLLGFLFSGILHAFVPQGVYNKYLSGNDFKSVLYATLFGIPLPLCSCGVIPTAMSLRKEGASKGATTAFLIATPQTGIDSIAATYSILGPAFAVIRPVAALFTALFGGLFVNAVSKNEKDNMVAADECKGDCCTAKNEKRSFSQKIVEALKYAFVDMMGDIGKWLVIGLVIAGLITVFVPKEFFSLFADSTLLSMLFVLLLAIPMYLCATGSIPIAVALMLKGLSPGTALLMLMAGPASNAASMLVVGKVLGKKTLIAYLASIICGAVLFGLAIDYLLPREWFTEKLTAIACCHSDGSSWFNIGCSILLGIMLIYAILIRPHHHHHEHETTNNKTFNMILHITGMNCNHCRANAEKAIANVEGVTSVHVDLQSGEAQIDGNPSIEDVRKAVEAIGFGLKE